MARPSADCDADVTRVGAVVCRTGFRNRQHPAPVGGAHHRTFVPRRPDSRSIHIRLAAATGTVYAGRTHTLHIPDALCARKMGHPSDDSPSAGAPARVAVGVNGSDDGDGSGTVLRNRLGVEKALHRAGSRCFPPP